MSSPAPPSPPFVAPPSRDDSRGPFWEDLIVLLAIPVLWIFVLRIRHPLAMAVAILTCAALVWVLVRRIRRFNRAAPRSDDPEGPRPR